MAERYPWWGPDLGALPTPRTILAAERLRLAVSCDRCGHERDADLRALIDGGRGEVPVEQATVPLLGLWQPPDDGRDQGCTPFTGDRYAIANAMPAPGWTND